MLVLSKTLISTTRLSEQVLMKYRKSHKFILVLIYSRYHNKITELILLFTNLYNHTKQKLIYPHMIKMGWKVGHIKLNIDISYLMTNTKIFREPGVKKS